VDHVTPLTAALQHMVDRCTTPLYVQVDEDMLLEPDAIGRLHELTGREWQPNLALVVGQLYDPHLDRNIEGVKINSHAVGRQFPWDRYASVLERNRALEASGYRIARRPLPESGERMVFGTHVLDPHPSRVFERYRRLELFRLAYPDELAWFAEYPHVFLRRVLAHGDPADYYALMGIIAANLAGDGLTASDSTLEALETFLGVEHSADRDR